MSAKTLTTCPKEDCTKQPWGKGKVKRAITGGSGIIFKGSGFYVTDYRSDRYKEAAKKDSATPVTPAKPATETKTTASGTPATKAASKPDAKT